MGCEGSHRMIAAGFPQNGQAGMSGSDVMAVSPYRSVLVVCAGRGLESPTRASWVSGGVRVGGRGVAASRGFLRGLDAAMQRAKYALRYLSCAECIAERNEGDI